MLNHPLPWYSNTGAIHAGSEVVSLDYLVIFRKYPGTNLIMDDKRLKGDFASRRLQLRVNQAAYDMPVCVINVTCNTISEVIASKCRIFVDANGNPVVYNKQKMRNIVVRPINYVQELRSGKLLVGVQGLSEKFIIPKSAPLDFISFIQLPIGEIIFSYGRTDRKRIKV